MSETIFFSYSRADSEFVLNLAKTLRSSGANIWLDQLDIKPGSRWDKSIEKALHSSDTFLVVLSKSAVESTNVMDEVSFALEEQKKVVPVLMESCTIPFRLRRLQFADFSKDENKGIKTLIGALNLDNKVADKLSDVTADQELKSPSKSSKYAPYEVKLKDPSKSTTNTATEAKSTKSNIKTDTSSTKSSKSVWPYVLIGFLIVVAAGGWYFREDIFNNSDEDQWNMAKASKNIEGYIEYQKKFPKGNHFSDATVEINKIDVSAWETASSIDNVESYKTYKDEIPNGKYLEKAEETINELKEDSINWNKAKRLNTMKSYDEYLDRKSAKHKYYTLAGKAKDSISEALFLAIDIPDFEEANRVNIEGGETTTEETEDNSEIKTPEKTEPTEEELEKTAWEKAKNSNTFEGYVTFIKNDDKTGAYLVEAVNSLKNKGKTGWLYVGATNDNETFSSSRNPVVSVIYRKNSLVTNQSNVIPKVGDLVTLNASTSRRVYATSEASSGGSSIGNWQLDKKAYVLEIRKGGTAYYIKIIYNN